MRVSEDKTAKSYLVTVSSLGHESWGLDIRVYRKTAQNDKTLKSVCISRLV